MDNIDKYKSNGAIVFRGLSVFHVGFYVFTNQWKKLASHYVFIDEIEYEKHTEESLIEMLKYRCKPVKSDKFKYIFQT
jgi:hypothetical protein